MCTGRASVCGIFSFSADVKDTTLKRIGASNLCKKKFKLCNFAYPVIKSDVPSGGGFWWKLSAAGLNPSPWTFPLSSNSHNPKDSHCYSSKDNASVQ